LYTHKACRNKSNDQKANTYIKNAKLASGSNFILDTFFFLLNTLVKPVDKVPYGTVALKVPSVGRSLQAEALNVRVHKVLDERDAHFVTSFFESIF
jgi:hypothetical protein